MKILKFTFSSLTLIAVLFGCRSRNLDHQLAVKNWQQERLTTLTAADGWTTLCGLFWIENGFNSVGSLDSNQIRFPKEMPGQLGSFERINDTIYFIQANINVYINGNPGQVGQRQLIFPTSEETILSWRSYQWFIIQRSDRMGVRLRDTLHPNRELTEIPYYPIQSTYNIPATIAYDDTVKTINIENVLGQINARNIEGTLVFDFNGGTHSLTALDGGPDKFYIIFSDETNGIDTYGGGRFIYVDRPEGDHNTNIDFNKAYNPPCVFSVFATCPLPPKENHLPFKVEAGEKYLDLGLDH